MDRWPLVGVVLLGVACCRDLCTPQLSAKILIFMQCQNTPFNAGFFKLGLGVGLVGVGVKLGVLIKLKPSL